MARVLLAWTLVALRIPLQRPANTRVSSVLEPHFFWKSTMSRCRCGLFSFYNAYMGGCNMQLWIPGFYHCHTNCSALSVRPCGAANAHPGLGE
jgi:hypothetical protein